MDNEDGQKVSKYNSGIAIIMRLDNLWRDTHTHSRGGAFSKWNQDLDRIWCELARDIKEDEYKKKETYFDKFDEELIAKGNFEDNASEGFKDVKPEQIKKRAEQYLILMKKELFLRRLENTLGKGTAWDTGDGDDFE